jgi:hypothetical protein
LQYKLAVQKGEFIIMKLRNFFTRLVTSLITCLVVALFIIGQAHANIQRSVLDDLREMHKSVRSCQAINVGKSIGHTFGATIQVGSVVGLLFLNDYNGPAQTCAHVKAAEKSRIALKNIYEAKHFLKQIEVNYLALRAGEHDLSKHVSDRALLTLSEMTNRKMNLSDVVERVHDMNQQGMDYIIDRNPLMVVGNDACPRASYFVAPDYLALIKDYLVQQLK